MKPTNPVMAVTIMATALLIAAEIVASESSVAEGPVACWNFNGTAKDRGGDVKDDLDRALAKAGV